MTTPHKHAEVLRAIADGKEVQFKGEYSGEWLETKYVNLNPITHPDLEWRVKPEPKPDIVVDRHVCIISGIDFYSNQFDVPNVRYTFDGETRKLKKAEVIE